MENVRMSKTEFQGVLMYQKDIDILNKVLDTNIFTDGEKDYILLTFQQINSRENKRILS